MLRSTVSTKLNSIKNQKRVTFGDFYAPKEPEYNELTARMTTFEERYWPPSIPVKPCKLAEAGFYYTGKFQTYQTNAKKYVVSY